ncbi:ABC transporter permease [Nonomuraea guangzhouensis]|uniref:ABC transporter permease n=1 Tax=Nonomuraea guangzhouensis TaxID=1291555 RepID=A0ABW4GNF6_9ACTN|nr:ABC transporter permease [Nonomuraea guangzhouensis]
MNRSTPRGPIIMRLVRAELIKARAVRATWILAAVAPVFCALWVLVPLFAPASSDAARMAGVYNMAQQAYLFSLILGILGMAGEYRHQTITWAFLVTPRRGAVVTAKLVAYGLLGLLVGVLSALVTLAAGGVLLALRGHPALSSEVPLILLGGVLSTAIYGLLGVALAVLVRSQVGAITLAALLFAYGDGFLAWLVPDVYRWLPTGAARSLGAMRLEGGALLPAWGGGLLFVGYVAVIVLLARVLTLRRDVT